MSKRETVGFLSDYGLEDEFVGVCHGVMLRIAPHVKIIDIHHNIRAQDVRHGALVLRQSMAFLPRHVHLAVVDPGVGSARRAVALQVASGAVLVGPDNGLLLPAAAASGGVERAVELTNEAFLLAPVSRTFQGRDVFAPVAAHVASGVPVSELGPDLAASELVPLSIPEARVEGELVHAEVLQIDRFGNIQLNARPPQVAAAGVAPGADARVVIQGREVTAPLRETFSAVGAGELVLVEDSYGYLCLALNRGRAADALGARPGARVTLASPGGLGV
ncbi:MAG: SAM-dependent chlorinase/fluorinase [Actinomycetota bacterium]|nr:SAM-dependent chlorinase/fluorinase [Actinomycetota bacterium]